MLYLWLRLRVLPRNPESQHAAVLQGAPSVVCSGGGVGATALLPGACGQSFELAMGGDIAELAGDRGAVSSRTPVWLHLAALWTASWVLDEGC